MAVVKKKLITLAFSTDQEHVYELGNVRHLRKLRFHVVNGTVTQVGTTNDGVYQTYGPLDTFLKQITVDVDGKRKLQTNGRAEHILRAFFSPPENTLLKTALTSAAAHPVRAAAFVELDIPNTAGKGVGRWNTRTREAVLNLFQGDGDTVGGDMVASGSDAYTAAGSVEVIGVFDDNIARENLPGGTEKFFRKMPVTLQTDDLRIPLPPGVVFTHLLIEAFDNSLRSDALITRVKILKGETDIRRDIAYGALKDENADRFGLTLATGIPPYPGFALLDLNEDHDMTPHKMIDNRGAKSSETNLILETIAPTGTAWVNVYMTGIRVNF